MIFNPSLPSSYEYIHYTREDIAAFDLNRTYTQTDKDLAQNTPHGLWLSITGIHDWEKYILKNNLNPVNLEHEFLVKLKPSAKILVLYNTALFNDFTKKYGYFREQGRLVFLIRWEELIKDYQGIAFPHLFLKHFNMLLWQRLLCCTSACVWDLQAVETIVKLK
jgi:hypothetical protein